ncbi:MAG: tetratricopeptide repeat protein [Flavobacteriales bacterium]|nr:tetratricopeptide repeat protein [Flavobacteriales bacterium]
MRKVIHIIICFLIALPTYANEDSLIVYSLLEQAKQTTNTDSSMNFAEEALNYAKKQNYKDGILTVAKHFGNQYAQTGELEKSIELYREIIATSNFSLKQLSTAYNQIGIYHVYLGHYDSTEVYFLKALAARRQLNDSIGIGASLNNLGNVVMSKGDYDKSVGYFIKALKIREQINDSAGIASSTNNLGMIYYKQKKFDIAINYYQKALAINQHKNMKDKEVLILLYLGNIYDEMVQLDSSVYYYQIAIDKAKEVGDLRIIAMAYGNMGVTQHQLKNYDLAEKYMRKALKIRTESADIEGQAILYNNLATLFVATKRYKIAIDYFNKSLKLSNEIGYLETSRDNYLGLADAYENLHQFKEAFFAHQQYNVIKDSMLNEATNEQIALLNTQYETEKKEKEIAEQQLKISEQHLRVEQRNYALLGISLFVLFIAVIGGFIYRFQKQKHMRLQEENLLKDEIAQVNLQNKLHQERLAISGNLNDNIGTQLAYIISSVENMEHLFKSADEKLLAKLTDVAHFSRTTITQLRDTIWALNKDEISFEDLKLRLYNYIENAKLAQEQTIFNFKVELSNNFHLNSIQGVSIYRVVQEAINNAMKYAAATNVSLLITEKDEFLVLSIKDDGIGFNMAEIQLGNGLENMKNRASAIHANFSINSAPTEGTAIILEIPIAEFI